MDTLSTLQTCIAEILLRAARRTLIATRRDVKVNQAGTASHPGQRHDALTRTLSTVPTAVHGPVFLANKRLSHRLARRSALRSSCFAANYASTCASRISESLVTHDAVQGRNPVELEAPVHRHSVSKPQQVTEAQSLTFIHQATVFFSARRSSHGVFEHHC